MYVLKEYNKQKHVGENIIPKKEIWPAQVAYQQNFPYDQNPEYSQIQPVYHPPFQVDGNNQQLM